MINPDELQKALKLSESGMFDEAAKLYNILLEKDADNYFVLASYGLSEFENKNYNKAIELLEKAARFSEDEKIYCHLVKALIQTGQLLKAEQICVEFLKKHQKAGSLWFELGFLKELIYSDDRQALQCYQVVLNLGIKSAHYNMAVSYQKLGDYKNAEENYKKMLEYNPGDIDTETSLGMCYLAQRKFKEGYELFVKRENNKNIPNLWLGGEVNKDLQIYCDQGFGDHIQFIRYIPFLKGNIKIAAPPALKELFEKNYPNVKFITYDEIDPNIQTIRITDLAYALGIDFNNIPFKEGYLNSDKANIHSTKPKVGLCWEAGSAGIRTMINRTINIKLLEPFLNLDNIQIYSFQVRDTLKGNERYPQMINLSCGFKNFEDTARAMKAMDLMITVDTSVAHLAGALGVKTFLMLPYASDWRWFNNTKTTDWYNSVEIFKQNDPISWEKPIGDILCRLKEYSL